MARLLLLSCVCSVSALQLPVRPCTPAKLASGPTRSADSLFDEAVAICERCATVSAWNPDLWRAPGLLREVFDRDFESLSDVARVQNVTCRRPASVPVPAEEEAGSEPFGYGVLGEALLGVPTQTGRACLHGSCCAECSRVEHPGFVGVEEAEALREAASAFLPPPGEGEVEGTAHLIDFICSGNVRGTLSLVRLVERARRAIAREYGLPLETLVVDSAFVSRILGLDGRVANGGDGPACSGDGPAEEEYSALHCDEGAIGAHYSAVLYLSTQGRDFDGGDFVWHDRGAESRVAPVEGHAVYFSSGWENVHCVDAVSSGTRFALPIFFSTVEPSGKAEARPMPAAAAATALWRNALMPRREEELGQPGCDWQLPLLWHDLFSAAGDCERK